MGHKATAPPPLTVRFEWDSVADVYLVSLENGARFALRREDVGGKLENNLDLYRRKCMAMASEATRPAPPAAWDYGPARDAYIAEKPITRVGVAPKPVRIPADISLEELGL